MLASANSICLRYLLPHTALPSKHLRRCATIVFHSILTVSTLTRMSWATSHHSAIVQRQGFLLFNFDCHNSGRMRMDAASTHFVSSDVVFLLDPLIAFMAPHGDRCSHGRSIMSKIPSSESLTELFHYCHPAWHCTSIDRLMV